MYNLYTIKKSQHLTIEWSGGTTTQLVIYPDNANYVKRNFLWRVSTARVEVEESVFTKLPGIFRILMLLEGNILLKHEGHGEHILEPFQQCSFKGDWLTKGYGCVTDFNLMLAEGCHGVVNAHKINSQTNYQINLFPIFKQNFFEKVTEVFYFITSINIDLSNGTRMYMEHGDLLVINGSNNIENSAIIGLYNKFETHAHVIQTTIYYNTK